MLILIFIFLLQVPLDVVGQSHDVYTSIAERMLLSKLLSQRVVSRLVKLLWIEASDFLYVEVKLRLMGVNPLCKLFRESGVVLPEGMLLDLFPV